MKSIVLVFGLISGTIVSAMFIITLYLYRTGAVNMGGGEIIGYSTMVISLSLIFFGIKSYRDNHLSGVIKFGKGLQVGLLIAVVASLFYATAWEITYTQFMPDFLDQYATMCEAKAKAEGASQIEMEKVLTRIDQTREIYKSPVLRFGLTFMEIFPVGVVIALISAAMLRKKEVLPA
jgi:hypothetical protein